MIRTVFSTLLIATFSLVSVFAQEKMNVHEAQEEIFKVVEEMPRFPGCEDDGSVDEKQKCAQNLMLRYLYSNLKYPSEAREVGVEGMAVVTFIVNKEGKLDDIKVVRNLGYGVHEACINLIEQMNNEITWIPGKQRGQAVSVQYTMPLRFKLESSRKKNSFYQSKQFKKDFSGIILYGHEIITFDDLDKLDLSKERIDLVEDPERALSQYNQEAPDGLLFIDKKGR